MASHIWQARTDHANILQTSSAVAEGFKLFTQCIGHDLRTPMQALIFSNFKAQRNVRDLIVVDDNEGAVEKLAVTPAQHEACETARASKRGPGARAARASRQDPRSTRRGRRVCGAAGRACRTYGI